MIQRVWLFFCLCFLCLSACGTGSTTPTSHPSTASSCGTAGATHTIQTASLPSAQGAWPLFRGDLTRDGAAISDGGKKLNLAWSYCTGAAVFSSPAVNAGMVFVASTNGTIVALDARTGKKRWLFQAGGNIYSSPAIQNGVLYVGALDGFVYAVDTTSGRLHWRSSAGDPQARIWSSPVVVNGLVVVGVASTLSERPKVSGAVVAFDATTGARRWRTWSESGGGPGGGIWSSPAVDTTTNTIYVGMGDPDDGAEALEVSNGQVIWRWRSVQRDVADTDVGSGPLLYHDQEGHLRVVVGGKDGFLYSLDAQHGSEIWRTHIGDHVFSSPAFVQRTLYAVAVLKGRSMSWALDAETGAPRWQHPLPAIDYASPAVASQTLYLGIGDAFGRGDGGIAVLDAETGSQFQYADLHSTVTASPALLQSWLYVGAGDGNLFAFVRSNGS